MSCGFGDAVRGALGGREVGHLLDIATGTGRMLKIAGLWLKAVSV